MCTWIDAWDSIVYKSKRLALRSINHHEISITALALLAEGRCLRDTPTGHRSTPTTRVLIRLAHGARCKVSTTLNSYCTSTMGCGTIACVHSRSHRRERTPSERHKADGASSGDSLSCNTTAHPVDRLGNPPRNSNSPFRSKDNSR